MVSKFRERIRKAKEDNQGAAIIVAVVAIAFIGMLIAMLVYMAYYNYLMKHLDKSSKDNFYTAEYALDAINAGLQKDISESMSDAYVKTMKLSANMDAHFMTKEFQTYYGDSIKNKIKDGSSDQKWNQAHLVDMLTEANVTIASYAGDEGAFLTTVSGKENTLVVKNDKMTLQNLKIVYTDKKGFISIIETDIRLQVPDLDFAQSSTDLNLETYSLIANTKLVDDSLDEMPISSTARTVNSNIKKGESTVVTGSVYGGKEGTYIGNIGNFSFVKDEKDKSGTDVVSYRFIADSLNVTNIKNSSTSNFVLGDTEESNRVHTIDVNDINITSSNFTSYAKKVLVGDDMDIQGRNSSVKVVADSYIGYGNRKDKSANSSAILINGGNTSIDFSGLKSLMLSGHAYVGAKKYDTDVDRLAFGVSRHTDSDTVGADGSLGADGVADSVEYHTHDDDSEHETNDSKSGNQQYMLTKSGDLDDDKIEYKDQKWYENHVGQYNLPRYYEDTNGRMLNDLQINEDGSYVSDPANGKDLMLGESISITANQLLYMVPNECIGLLNGTDEPTSFSHNPLTYSEYLTLTTEIKDPETSNTTNPGSSLTGNAQQSAQDNLKYKLCNLDVLWTKMGSAKFTENPQTVFRRINGEVMVYLYLDFSADETMANEFFRAYYKYDPTAVEQYVKSYINEFKWNSALNSNMTLAGNAFMYTKSKNLSFVEDDASNSKKSLDMDNYAEEYSESHQSYMHMLGKPYESLTSAELSNDLYTNLVDEETMAKLVAFNKSAAGKSVDADGKYVNGMLDSDTTNGVTAVVSDGDVVYPNNDISKGLFCPNNTALIITDGDVYLTKDYDGLVIAKGTVYICEGCTKVTYNATKVFSAMRKEIKHDSLGVDVVYHVYDIFGESGRNSYGVAEKSASKGSINLNDLITYQNWKKE